MHLPDFLESEAALDALLAGFEDGTWPKAQWTHAAHLATAACYILAFDDALDRLRAGIPRYNVSQGARNTEDSGYHETLTVFWHNVIRDFIQTLPPSQERLTIIRTVVTEFAAQRDLFKQYYDFDVVNSREARAKWIPPTKLRDIATLPKPAPYANLNPIRRRFMNHFPALTTALALSLCACAGVAAQPKPTFEAVSIKPVPAPTRQEILAGPGRPFFNADETHLEVRNFTLLLILNRAFQSSHVDAPDFARQEYFNIQATLPAGATREQVPEMLRTVLAERFKLAIHRETRDYLMTVVTLGKSGMKLIRLPDDTPAQPQKQANLADGTTQTTMVGKLPSLFPVMSSFGGFPEMDDQTGLDGVYTWVVNRRPANPGETFQDVTHEAYKATVEAAGLKLEERKVPKETIVVDHLEKTPTEN